MTDTALLTTPVKLNAVGALLLILFSMAFVSYGQTSRGFLTDFDAAKIEAGQSGQHMLVNIYSKTCFSSKQLEQEVFRSKAFSPYTDELVCVSIDIESGDGTYLKDRYGIAGCPTILFLTAAGKELERITSYIPRDFLIGELHRILEGRTVNAVEQSYPLGGNYEDAFLLTLYYCRNDYQKEKLDRYYKEIKRLDPAFKRDSSHVLVRFVLDKELKRGVGSAAGDIEEYTYLFPDHNASRLAIMLTDYYLKIGDKEGAWEYFSDYYLLSTRKDRIEQYYQELKTKTGH